MVLSAAFEAALSIKPPASPGVSDFGDHQRRILAGIKQERANPSELTGKQALFVVNLLPKKMAGEVSEGMLFDIGYADGVTPVLAQPEQPVPNGTRAG